MFEFLQSKKRHTLVAYIMFGMIIVVFILWGIKGDDLPGAGYAAQVNDRVISVGEFARAYDRQTEFYAKMFGGQFDLDAQRRTALKERTLDMLIRREVLYQQAMKEGFASTDSEIRHQITSIPGFQKDGVFQREYYNSYLTQSHTSAAQFENQIRHDQVIETLRSRFESAGHPTKAEEKLEAQAKETKLKVDYATWDSVSLSQRIKSDKAAISKFLQTDKKKVEEFYNANKARYSEEGQVHARHILLKTPQEPAAQDKAAAKLKEIAERVKKGEDFGKIASEVSEDAGSKASKGDLGWFGRGRMVKPFEDAAFNLKAGSLSEPVKTDFGVHLIQVLEKKEEKVKSLDSVETDIASELLAAERLKEFNSKMDKALQETDGAKRAAQVESLVKAEGLKWETSEWFDTGANDIPKLGGGDEMIQTAFTLRKNAPVASKVVRSGVKSYVLRLNEIKRPDGSSTKDGSAVAGQNQGHGMDSLNQWQESLAKSASIERNSRILAE